MSGAADSRAGQDAADLRVGGQLGTACSWRPVFALAAAIAASEHLATPAILPTTPGREDGREAGDLLFAVFAGEAHVKGE